MTSDQFRRIVWARSAAAGAYIVTYVLVFAAYAIFLMLEYGLITLVAWTLRGEVASSAALAHALHAARVALAFTILAIAVVHGVCAAIEQMKAERHVSRGFIE